MERMCGLQKTCAEVLPTVFLDVHVSVRHCGSARDVRTSKGNFQEMGLTSDEEEREVLLDIRVHMG